jgi:sugar phosphate isomerase/epimerase
MKISVSMYSFHRTVYKENWTVLDFLDFAKAQSLEGVELLDIYWKDIENELPEVKRALSKYGLTVSAYDVTNDFVKKEKEEREKELDKVIEGIRTAKKLGTDVVRVFCGDLKQGIPYEEGKQWIVECLKKAVQYAEEAKIYLAVENHGFFAGKSEQVKEIIEEVENPYVRSTFDTGNFLLVGEDPSEAFARLKEEIVHVHFKDFRRKRETDPVGGFQSLTGEEWVAVSPFDGEVPLAKIVQQMKNAGYDQWMSLEYEGHEDPKKAVPAALERIRGYVS